MERRDLQQAIKETYEYFRYTNIPDDRTIEKWHVKVGFIPAIAVPWIMDQIQNLDTIPRNVPNLIISLWYSYQRANPAKVASDYEYCSDCFGYGTHMFEKKDFKYNPPMWVSGVALCSKCENYKKHVGSVFESGGKIVIERKSIGPYVPPIPRTTKQELINNGFKYLAQADPRAKKIRAEVPDISKIGDF
jgi:hypothetical protein